MDSLVDTVMENWTPSVSETLILPTVNISDLLQATNSTNSGNSTGEEINKFYFYETEQFLILWILFFIIVVGNSAVLFALCLPKKKRRSRMHYFMKHLAVADLSVGLLNVLTDIIWRITVDWEAGNVACKLIKFSQALVTYGSTYVLVALSLDRWDAITRPMNFIGSSGRARKLIQTAWFISAVFSFPLIVLYEEKVVQARIQCWIDFSEPWMWQLYMSLIALTLFVLPAFIIAYCYAKIIRTIWRNGTYVVSLSDKQNGNKRDFKNRASSRGIIPQAKVKSVKMTIVIVIVFISCWSPYIVFDLLQVFDMFPKTQSYFAIASLIQSLAPLNSAANPLIYLLFSNQIFQALVQRPAFRWLESTWCCKENAKRNNEQKIRETTLRSNYHNNHHRSFDSTKTLTTTFMASTRDHHMTRTGTKVVIIDRPKSIIGMPNEIQR